MSAFLLGNALYASDGRFRWLGIVWLVLFLPCLGMALGQARIASLEVEGDRLLKWTVGLALFAECVLLPTRPVGLEVHDWPSTLFLTGHVLVSALALAMLIGPRRQFALVLALHFALGVWLIHASPNPHIDVHVFQQDAGRALLAGQNPYAMTFPDIYAGEGLTDSLYGPGLAANGRVNFGFPYPPLTLLLDLPGVLLGDHRYSQLAAITGAAALMGWARPGWLSKAAAALYLFTPRGFFVLEQSWTEPFLVLALAFALFCAVRFTRILPYALGLLVASKQYLFIALPLFPLLTKPKQWLPFLVRAAVAGAVVSLPLASWNWSAFSRDVLWLQFRQPFRDDALSFLVIVHDSLGVAPGWLAWVAVASAVGLALWRSNRSPMGFALSLAVACFAFFAFNKQAFCNYYFFVIGALCVALSMSRAND